MAVFDKKSLWLVQMVWWETSEMGYHVCEDLNFGEPVSAFTTREAAELEMDRLEREAQAKANPFDHGTSLEYRTTMPEGVFLDWLQEGDIDLPRGQSENQWRAWWKAGQKKWSAEQLARIWHALDRVRFYVVVELPPS